MMKYDDMVERRMRGVSPEEALTVIEGMEGEGVVVVKNTEELEKVFEWWKRCEKDPDEWLVVLKEADWKDFYGDQRELKKTLSQIGEHFSSNRGGFSSPLAVARLILPGGGSFIRLPWSKRNGEKGFHQRHYFFPLSSGQGVGVLFTTLPLIRRGEVNGELINLITQVFCWEGGNYGNDYY